MIRMSGGGRLSIGILAVVVTCGGAWGGELDLPRAEFAKYYRQIVGKEMPEGLVALAIDPKVSKSGRDAYRIVTTGTGTTGVSPVAVGRGVPPSRRATDPPGTTRILRVAGAAALVAASATGC